MSELCSRVVCNLSSRFYPETTGRIYDSTCTHGTVEIVLMQFTYAINNSLADRLAKTKKDKSSISEQVTFLKTRSKLSSLSE